MTNDRGVKSKSRPEPLCLSYFQCLYQQLRSENELGISFQMSFVSLDWKHRKIISMLAPTLLIWWTFWKTYPIRIWQNPDYWWIDWQWTLFDSQTQWLKFKLRKHQKSHKGYSIQYVVLRKRNPDYWWKEWQWNLFWFHRPNGWSSKASKKPQRLHDPICPSHYH